MDEESNEARALATLFFAADRQGLRRRGRRVGQAEGHLARRPHPRHPPGKADPGAETRATN